MNTSSPKTESISSSVILAVREPKCTRCRNHGLIAKMKGHKNSCPYVQCTCAKCFLVEERRRISRQQIRLRRNGNLENRVRISSASLQRSDNISSSNLSNEPNSLYMNWPVSFPVAHPSSLHSSPKQSDLSHYYPSQNAPHISTACASNSPNSFIADNHSANVYYHSNNFSELTPPPPSYTQSPSNYHLQHSPLMNFAFKGFNNSATSCRSWFLNPVNPLRQGMATNWQNWQVPHYITNLAATRALDIPTDLTQNHSEDDFKLVNNSE